MRIGCIGMSLAAAALLAAPVTGQSSSAPSTGAPAEFLGGPLGLLHHEAVQKELKLTDEQLEQLNTLRAVQPGAIPGVQLRNAAGVAQATKSALKRILKPAQLTRLKQINLQAMLATGGLGAALSDPDVAADLGLTDSQKKKVAAAVDSIHKKASKTTGAKGDAKKKKDAVDSTGDAERKALDARVQPLLTDEQKAKLAELQGTPFKQLQAVIDEARGKGGDHKAGEPRRKEGS